MRRGAAWRSAGPPGARLGARVEAGAGAAQAASATTADPGTADLGTADPGTADPGTADLGTVDPGVAAAERQGDDDYRDIDFDRATLL